MSESGTMMRYEAMKKSTLVAYVLWWFFGLFGGHRFYLGRSGSAAAMLTITLISIPLTLVVIGLVTLMVTGIWAIVDAFLIPGMVQEHNLRLASMMDPQLEPQPEPVA